MSPSGILTVPKNCRCVVKNMKGRFIKFNPLASDFLDEQVLPEEENYVKILGMWTHYESAG
jgi:hypothetical protein